MTPSEELTYKLCKKSFLSLWSFPNPKGKKNKELCDILVVCEPDIIIISVKEIEYKDTGDEIGVNRWRKNAIEKSCKQIYGAERWINSNTSILTKDGENNISFPTKSDRQVHRVSVSLGSKGKVPMSSADFGKGFVHVLDEISLGTILGELDTISDFIKYLTDKEEFLNKGIPTIVNGGEEDLLAFYLSNNRTFPDEPSMIVLDGNLWNNYINDSTVLDKKEADKISYIWDQVIEEIYQTYLSSNFITGDSFTNELTDLEKALRVMAREDRFARRRISMSLVDFLQNFENQNIKARISPNSSCKNEVLYVFQASKYDGNRQMSFDELQMRCIVAKGLNTDKTKIIGIMTEFSELEKGSATSLCFLEIDEWNEEWQQKMDLIQKELGYFASPRKTKFSGDKFTREYPDLEN